MKEAFLEKSQGMEKKQAHVAEWKKEDVRLLISLVNEYPTIGLLDITGLPSYQLQKMRAQLKDSAVIFMTRLNLIKLALQQSNKQSIKELEKHVNGVPALIFSKKDSFRLSKILIKNKSSAKAKQGQLAPYDIVVPAGPTPFTPGPVIGELGQLGIKTVIEAGKINVKEDSVVVKKGNVISEKVATMLGKLSIEPMEIGLNLVASYENGNIYAGDVLNVNEKDYIEKIKLAYRESFNLAVNAAVPMKETITLLLQRAYREAAALAAKLNIEVSKGAERTEVKEEKPLEKQEAEKSSLEKASEEEEKLAEVKTGQVEAKPISDREFKEHEAIAKKLLSNLQAEKAKHFEMPKHKEEKFKKVNSKEIVGG